MIKSDKICELRVVCRNDSEGKYPFSIYTAAKYFYPSFAAAEVAIPNMVEKYASQKWMNVYQYVIYTFTQNTEITEMSRDAADIAVYLPDGSPWIRTGAEGIIRKGEIYEHIDAGNNVHVCIIEEEARHDNTCGHLILNSDYTKGWSYITDVMPCTYPVSHEYSDALKSKLARHDEVEQRVLTPTRGVPYAIKTKHNEDMNDYLYVPASFSGFKYDLFFDCNAAYRKNMHPLWFYVAHPLEDKMILLPITVSSELTLMWEEHGHLMYDLCITENLIDFIQSNLQDIMNLADCQYGPDYFLWNMMKMNNVTNMQIGVEGEKNL
ncbi:MAG: hypothetical protein J6V20_08250 [Bacteroidaceae bacterium]|nr:hypothetical protein [Bacteroidaceae bacterium]